MTMTKTKTMTKTNTFREHLQRAIPETCDPLGHLIRVRRGDDLTKKMTNTDTKTKTKTSTKTNTRTSDRPMMQYVFGKEMTKGV